MSMMDSDAPPTPKTGDGYFKRRQDMMYYRYIQVMAGRLAADATSLIDVGSWNTSMAEEMDWIAHRVALDLRVPYSSEKVIGVKADFYEYQPERRFDFALCLQVLEHVPDAAAFAQKLLAVADRVLVSVPYKWPEGVGKGHVQDPVDEKKVAGWFDRKPDYQIVVEEPLTRGRSSRVKARRLIAYYHRAGEPFRVEDIPRRPPQRSPG